eukprot:CAMPEP_0196781360 /NCGR_PEP_ID=MMETSP1104-20130614/9604_1 /TAXON_ID=33652 /ORGANISM="Cafeteria sp., Strain Caron Lab Isolate" /LENGTH=404 /DNA_ID=CAMNT_0042151589 /DNA_START=53 /DNA_END=1264 /DNA_ORIENTATION=-
MQRALRNAVAIAARGAFDAVLLPQRLRRRLLQLLLRLFLGEARNEWVLLAALGVTSTGSLISAREWLRLQRQSWRLLRAPVLSVAELGDVASAPHTSALSEGDVIVRDTAIAMDADSALLSADGPGLLAWCRTHWAVYSGSPLQLFSFRRLPTATQVASMHGSVSVWSVGDAGAFARVRAPFPLSTLDGAPQLTARFLPFHGPDDRPGFFSLFGPSMLGAMHRLQGVPSGTVVTVCGVPRVTLNASSQSVGARAGASAMATGVGGAAAGGLQVEFSLKNQPPKLGHELLVSCQSPEALRSDVAASAYRYGWFAILLGGASVVMTVKLCYGRINRWLLRVRAERTLAALRARAERAGHPTQLPLTEAGNAEGSDGNEDASNNATACSAEDAAVHDGINTQCVVCW